MRQISGDACGWACPVVSPSCPGLSPARAPSDQSPGHSKGTTSPCSLLYLNYENMVLELSAQLNESFWEDTFVPSFAASSYTKRRSANT